MLPNEAWRLLARTDLEVENVRVAAEQLSRTGATVARERQGGRVVLVTVKVEPRLGAVLKRKEL